MGDVGVRAAIDRTLTAVRERPAELCAHELVALSSTGRCVTIDRTGPETVVTIDRGQDQRLAGLTPRELDIARLVACGLTNIQVANTLFVSVSTVKDHLHSIFTKAGLSSRSQLTAAYYGGLSATAAEPAHDG